MCAGGTGSLSEIDPIGTANQEGLEGVAHDGTSKTQACRERSGDRGSRICALPCGFGMRAFDLKGLVLMVAFFSAVAKVSTVKRARNPMF